MALKIDIFPCLSDNYGFLVRDEASGKVACIDTPEASKIIARAESLGWRVDYILNTHWHPDHGGGNAEVKAHFGCDIYGPAEVGEHWPLDHVLKPGDVFRHGETRLDVIDLHGHTHGIVGYLDAAGHNVFVADCIFPLGCGRMFEGTPQQFWKSLSRLAALPDDTVIWSAHEYTLANLKFAESLGELDALKVRGERIQRLRGAGQYTVPSTVAEEKATNPFLVYPLREKSFEAQAAKFAELRAAKDAFR